MELALATGAGTIGVALVVGIYVIRTLERAHKAERAGDLLTAALAASEIEVRRQEKLLANRTHSDPLINAAYGAALRALPATTAALIAGNLAAAQLHADSQSDGPRDLPKPLPPAPGVPLATRLR